MKASLALAGLVAAASAHAVQKRDGYHSAGEPYTTTTLTKTTYLTTCPVTTTKTEGPNTVTETYMTISTLTTEVPHTIVITPTHTTTVHQVPYLPLDLDCMRPSQGLCVALAKMSRYSRR